MADIEKIFKREDGTEAKIKIFDFTSPFSKVPEFDCHFYTRKKEDKNWTKVESNTGSKKLPEGVSVSEFVKKHRNPIFYIVTIAELLNTISIFRNQYKDSLN